MCFHKAEERRGEEEKGVLAFCVGIVVTKWVWQLQRGPVQVYSKGTFLGCGNRVPSPANCNILTTYVAELS